jgi:MraZ protein
VSFTGEYRHTVDAKGRLIVPSRLRDELEDNRAVLTKWTDGCIAMWSGSHWRKFELDLLGQSRSDPDARAAVRLIAASTHQDEVDRQGRISVPRSLLQHADIERDAVIVGSLDHAEIWNPERWDQERAKGEQGRLDVLVGQLNL